MSLPVSTSRGPSARPVRAPRPEQPVRVVPSTRPGAPRAPFVAVVLFLLVAGLGLLLLLNTLLAQGSFVVDDLDRQITVLSDREQSMQQKVATLAAPGRLAHQANNLGMVSSVNPVFLRMPDGRILGDPVVAPGTAPPPTSVTDPKEARESEAPVAGDADADAEGTAPGDGADEKANQGPADEKGAGDQKAGDQKHDGGAGHDHNNA